jgi:hypothetical protein
MPYRPIVRPGRLRCTSGRCDELGDTFHNLSCIPNSWRYFPRFRHESNERVAVVTQHRTKVNESMTTNNARGGARNVRSRFDSSRIAPRSRSVALFSQPDLSSNRNTSPQDRQVASEVAESLSVGCQKKSRTIDESWIPARAWMCTNYFSKSVFFSSVDKT